MGRFNLDTVQTRMTTADVAVALVEEGYELESYSTDEAKTKPAPIMFRRGRKTLEFQIWYLVKKGTITVYCTERTLPVWRFRECTDSVILELIRLDLDAVRGLK